MVVFEAKRNGRYRDWKNGRQQALTSPVFRPLVGTTAQQTGVYGIQGRF